MREKRKGWQVLRNEPRTPGPCSQCSVTELRQPDNHQPLQSSICGTEMPQSHTWQPLIRTPLGIDWKILSIRKQSMLSHSIGTGGGRGGGGGGKFSVCALPPPPKFSDCATPTLYVLYYKLVLLKTVPPNHKVFPT